MATFASAKHLELSGRAFHTAGGKNMKISNIVGDERKTILQHFLPVNSVMVSQDFMAMGTVVH